MTKRGAEFRKPVSHSDWWWLAHPPKVSPVIQAVVEGYGDLDPGGLEAALAQVTAVCPDLALVRRGRRWLTTGTPPRVRVVDCGAGEGRGSAERGVPDVPALHDPLPGPDGALCEVLLCPGDAAAGDAAAGHAAAGHAGPGRPTVLVFRASHAVMDWPGMTLWIEETFRALRGEQVTGAPSALTETDVFDRFPPVTEAVPDPPIDRVSPLEAPAVPGAHRTGWARRTVDGYHPALAAKAAVALSRAYGTDGARFSIAFDLRRHAPGERTTGNLSLVELFDVAPGESWEPLHERVLTVMAEGREVTQRLEPGMMRLPLPVLRTMIRGMERIPAEKRRYAAQTVIAHMGRLPEGTLRAPDFEGLTLYPAPLLGAVGPPDLNLAEVGGRTEITLTWRADPGLAERSHELLDRIAELLSPAADRALSGGPTDRPLPADTVVDRFRARAAAGPEAVALRRPGGTMTLGELDHRSEVVAAHLVARGIGRESVVALLADRSAGTVAALWGVLKAGAAYLPLDPRHPDARLKGIVTDAGAARCLIPAAGAGRDLAPDGCPTDILDTLPYDGPRPAPAPGRAPAPGDLAYVIYTSGSTGRPKGVEVEHRALAAYTDRATEHFGVDASTAFGVITSLAFDLSNTALFAPVLAGGSLVLMPGEPDHLTLRQLLTESGVNTLSLTPSHLDLISRLELRPDGLRTLVVIGEQLTRSAALRARRTFGPDCRILNMYGPTEATVGCTLHTFDPGRDGQAAVPVGVPMAHCTVHLLDAQRRHVPAGETGEMYLGGVQVARGYRGRPDLTAERFVRLADGSRVYRSGDLARRLPGGVLEFAGRADDQVKVMGHRVEPAETVQALETHPAVRTAAVVARARPGGHNYLSAYVVLRPGEPAADWAAYLTERLPAYLVPAVTTVVPDLPYNANGKVDTGALAEATEAEHTEAESTEAEAAGPDPGHEPDDVERSVAKIWADTLGIEAARLDPRTDFHQLGGNSLLLLSMLAEVCRTVVGEERERAFMAELGRIVREPTLDTVSTIARKVRDGATGTPTPRT
ncbi:hypothetical protein QR77_29130 [Streptomyces sp. 150FB]|uniref:amino acid adenylation domain-containing protein n=1 Tax=Streptomyces sp. 150FB TaxID=1576605 RepID=UPI00058914EC|nr:amino acid adenylation domain-containing protein [Streptomyces sp. 150FB]KIF76826.1 hypothetical protein QR77_29130 [Streptomyces sp. 150FB]